MPVSYTYLTLSQARAFLASRLLDPTNVYWSAAELNSFLISALRTTQALTSFYREFNTFPSQLNVPFYDLTTVAFTAPLSPLSPNPFGYTVTTADLYTHIERFLLEPPTIPYSGSTQFTSDQINTALQNTINHFLLDTGCVVSWPVRPNVTAGVSRVMLPDLTLAVRRAAFVDSTSTTTPPPINPLWRQDEFAANSFQVGWQQAPDTATSYSPSASPPETLQLIPPPVNSGVLDLLTIQAGPNVGPVTAADPQTVMVPDDFSAYVLWGALADLLSTDGQSRDFTRAAYCRQRYMEGVAVATAFPSVLTASINGMNANLCAVSELDAFTPDWESTVGVPSTVGMASRNLLALSPVPDGNGPYTVGVDLVRNMPVPVLDTDYLQIPKDMVDPILEYSHHLACFKMSGAEFANSISLYQSWLRACGKWNARLTAMAFYRTAMEQPAMRQGAMMELQTQSASSPFPPTSTNSAYPSV